MAANDIFGYIELSDPDAVPRDVLVHNFELRRRGEELVPSMKLVGEDPSVSHIELLKSTSQEKRRAERRVLTKGTKAIRMETSIVADTPTTMEIPLYHFASDVESFLENPKVIKAADILPPGSPLLTPRSVSTETSKVFGLKAGVDGLTFSPSRAKFTDFYVGPVGDKDHRVALHGFLAEPAVLFIQGRGKVMLQPGFEMVSILKGTITQGFKPTGKVVPQVIPAQITVPTKYASPSPDPTFFEKQDPKSLGCGRHALNNLLGGTYFIKDDSSEITDTTVQDLPIPISLMSLCKYLTTKKAVGGATPCPENENYEDSVIMGALRVIGYSATPIILEEISDTPVGFIANKNGDHWVAIRREGDGYRLIDSLTKDAPSTVSLEDIKKLAVDATYASLMKVEYQGSFIAPVTEVAEVVQASPTVLETLTSAMTPAPAEAAPAEAAPAEAAPAEAAPAEETSTVSTSAATATSAESAPVVSTSAATAPTLLETLASVVAPAPAPAPAPASLAAIPEELKCTKVEGTVDDFFSENIHTAIKEFITNSRPDLLSPANEERALQNKNLNSYLTDMQKEKAGKTYVLILPTHEGNSLPATRSGTHIFTIWRIPQGCTMGGDVIKVSATKGNRMTGEAPTGNSMINPKMGGAATEWIHFKFELAYV